MSFNFRQMFNESAGIDDLINHSVAFIFFIYAEWLPQV